MVMEAAALFFLWPETIATLDMSRKERCLRLLRLLGFPPCPLEGSLAILAILAMIPLFLRSLSSFLFLGKTILVVKQQSLPPAKWLTYCSTSLVGEFLSSRFCG